MKEALIRARQIIWRYRHETPLVNQPHMIAIDADEAFELIDAALAQEQEPVNRCVRELREFAKLNQGTYIFPSWDGNRVLKYLGDTTPPQPEKRNFCSRFGKRTADLTVIHTCTPPQENT